MSLEKVRERVDQRMADRKERKVAKSKKNKGTRMKEAEIGKSNIRARKMQECM